MNTIKAIQSSALLIALAACVKTSSLMDSPSLVPSSVSALTAEDVKHVDALDWARLDEVGFNVRHSRAHGGYFVDADQIAAMHPQTVADVFRHVPVLLESPLSYTTRPIIGPTPCFLTYVDGLIRRGKGPSSLDNFVPAKDVIGAEIYPPDQLPPPPFARSSSDESCTTVAIWTRTPHT